MARTITWIIVAVVVIAGVWYYFNRSSQGASSNTSTNYQQGQTIGTNASGTSNSDLDQGMTSIDSQMNAAANASASANDTSDNPVMQTE